MKYGADYEDDLYVSPMPYAGEGIIFTTGHQPAAPRLGVPTLAERVDAELDEIRRRLTALEDLARFQHNQ